MCLQLKPRETRDMLPESTKEQYIGEFFLTIDWRAFETVQQVRYDKEQNT